MSSARPAAPISLTSWSRQVAEPSGARMAFGGGAARLCPNARAGSDSFLALGHGGEDDLDAPDLATTPTSGTSLEGRAGSSAWPMSGSAQARKAGEQRTNCQRCVWKTLIGKIDRDFDLRASSVVVE